MRPHNEETKRRGKIPRRPIPLFWEQAETL